jgi:hypothetical protein
MSLNEFSAEIGKSASTLKNTFGSVSSTILASTADLVGKMADGQAGATLYNRQVADIARLGGGLLSNIPLLGKAFSGAAGAAALAENQVAKQADAEYKNYQDLSRNGLSSGMDSAFKNLTNLSYTFKDMGEGAKLLKDNSATLAALGGGAEAGVEQLVSVSTSIKNSGMQDQFVRMGKTIPEINAGILNYVKYQQQSGHVMQQDSAESAKAAQEYMLEQDKLTKITGLSADEQQAVRDQAMSSEQYAAHRFLLEEELANTKDEATKEAIHRQLKNEDALLANAKTQGPKELASMTMYLSGNVTTKAAQGAGLMYGNIKDRLRTLNPGETLNAVNKANADFVKQYGDLAIAGKANQLFDISYAEKLKGAARATTDYTKAGELAVLKQQAQMAGEDKTTKAYADMTQAQRKASLDLQKTLHLGVPLLSEGLSKIATASSNVTEMFKNITNKLTGGTPEESKSGSGGLPLDNLSKPGISPNSNGNLLGGGLSFDPKNFNIGNTGGKAGSAFPGVSGTNNQSHQNDASTSSQNTGSGSIYNSYNSMYGGPAGDNTHSPSFTGSVSGPIDRHQNSPSFTGSVSGPIDRHQNSLDSAESGIHMATSSSDNGDKSKRNSGSQVNYHEEELNKLDSMIYIMQKQNAIANKMLSRYN